MKKLLFLSALFVLLISLFSCSDDDDVDDQKPVIDLSFDGAFPTNCDTLYFGETFYFKAFFSDNEELGSYSIDIHNNFDHHSHSTEAGLVECSLDPVKTSENPFLYIEKFSFPEGNKGEHETSRPIKIPDEGEKGAFEGGDYHFFISVTDKTGWTAQKGLSIKILRR
jgi:hypothetical protein